MSLPTDSSYSPAFHWMAASKGSVDDPDDATKRVQNWSRRKRRMFTAQHIESAWHHLHTTPG